MVRFEMFKSRSLAMWVIGLPLLLAVLYYALFAQDRYVSTAQVVVRQTQGGEAPALPGLAGMLGGINPTSREETMFLREFITSMDMLNVLQDKLKWSEHYAGRWQDPLYWLSPDAPREDQLEYYRRVVQAYFDEQTGLLLVEVQAFAPEFAQQVLQVVLAESERFVNEISHRMAREQMQFAEAELAKARKHYEDQRAIMLQFQGANNLLDPEAAAMARATTLADLEGLLIKERATLKALLATLSPNTPQVRQQRTRIEALEQQLQAESRRLVSAPAGDKLNVIAAQYRSLMVDAGIAEEAYKFAVTATETARIESLKKLRSLVTVVSPNKPDLAIYPERIYNLITIFVVLLLLYGIARFIIATIEDHRD